MTRINSVCTSLNHSQPSSFKKDYKRMMRRGKDKRKLQTVLDILLSGDSLPDKYRNHALKGNYNGCMECHIEPDWLLIYRIIDSKIYLERTGTRSDLFNMQFQQSSSFDSGGFGANIITIKFELTASDGKSYETQYYNLDVIISVGYRVKSKRGTPFRIWANQILKDHLVKGYSVNTTRLIEQKLELDVRESSKMVEQVLRLKGVPDDLETECYA